MRASWLCLNASKTNILLLGFIADFDSLDQQWSLCPSTLQRHWFRRLFQTAWITATLLSVASLTPCWRSCSRFRMRRPGYSHKLMADENTINTLHQSRDSSTGYLSAVESTLSWQSPDFTRTGSHVLARQVQVGLWSEQRQTTTFCQCSDIRGATHEDETRRSFAAAGPRLWNSLPVSLLQSETLTTFKRQTFLFSDEAAAPTPPSDSHLLLGAGHKSHKSPY